AARDERRAALSAVEVAHARGAVGGEESAHDLGAGDVGRSRRSRLGHPGLRMGELHARPDAGAEAEPGGERPRPELRSLARRAELRRELRRADELADLLPERLAAEDATLERRRHRGAHALQIRERDAEIFLPRVLAEVTPAGRERAVLDRQLVGREE